VKSLYADNAKELHKAAKKLGWGFPTATPGQPKTNGLAERTVRRVKEGGRANVIQGGFEPTWWPYACAHHCFARNIKVVDGDSSYNKRHKAGHCKALQIPFGACVEFLPVANPNDKNKTFEAKTRVGLFVGYHVQPGGRWTGDYLVVEFEALRYSPDLPPSSCKVHRTSEVVNFKPTALHFPLADYRRLEEKTVLVDPPAPEKQTSDADAPGQIDLVPRDPVEPTPSDTTGGRPLSGEAPAADGADDEGVDTRGAGGTVGSRKVRAYKGSTRPPNVDPDAWALLYTPKDRERLIAEYRVQGRAQAEEGCQRGWRFILFRSLCRRCGFEDRLYYVLGYTEPGNSCGVWLA